MEPQYSIDAAAMTKIYANLFVMTPLSQIVIYTIGHSDRQDADFVKLLTDNGIETLVDIRVFPGSRRHPQFNKETLRAAIQQAGIEYHWAGKQLGGNRSAHPKSPHVALSEKGLRGFADYMASDVFQRAISQLVHLAAKGKTAIMCAERSPERCHRSLISDYLVLQGYSVIHLVDTNEQREHHLRTEARRESATPIYDRFADGDLGF